MSLVEFFFSIVTRHRVRRGSFTSPQVLYGALHGRLQDWNRHPMPFSRLKPQQVLVPHSMDISATERWGECAS